MIDFSFFPEFLSIGNITENRWKDFHEFFMIRRTRSCQGPELRRASCLSATLRKRRMDFHGILWILFGVDQLSHKEQSVALWRCCIQPLRYRLEYRIFFYFLDMCLFAKLQRVNGFWRKFQDMRRWQKQQLVRLLHAWLGCFTFPKQGTTKVCALRVLIVLYVCLPPWQCIKYFSWSWRISRPVCFLFPTETWEICKVTCLTKNWLYTKHRGIFKYNV